MNDLAAVEESADCFLAKTIRSMEKKMNDTVTHENVVDDVSNSGDYIETGNFYANLKKSTHVLFIDNAK